MENTTWDLSTLHWDSIGSGRDVLLVHGWSSSSMMWTALVNTLQEDMRFWMLDLPGFGSSPLIDMPNDVDHYTSLLAQFCDAHELRPDIVIGHSMGGMLTLKLALNRPDLMKRLILVCPVITGRVGWFFELNQIIQSKIGHLTLQYSRGVWEFAQNVAPFFSSFPSYHPKETRERIMHEFRSARWQAAADSLKSLAAENLEPHLPHIDKPTLVIVGCHDFTVPPDEGRLAARLIPYAQLVEFANSHHQPLDEETPYFIETMRRFLDAAD